MSAYGVRESEGESTVERAQRRPDATGSRGNLIYARDVAAKGVFRCVLRFPSCESTIKAEIIFRIKQRAYCVSL